jgi:stage V sporulation protein G
MNPLESRGSGKTLAYFDVQTQDEIVLKGFRLVNGPHGLFISAPSDKGKDGKFYESIVLPKEMKSEVEKLAKEEYSRSHQN